MKKLSIFLLGALAIAATSCEEDPDFGGTIQSNPQGPIYGVEGVTVEQPSVTTVSIPESTAAATNIALGNLAVSEFPEGYTMKVVTYISKEESFNPAFEVPTTVVDNVVYATPEDLQNVYVNSISKSPAAKDIFVRFAIFAVDGASEYRIGDENSFVGGYALNVTPMPSELVIEDNYYLLGTINGWDVATAVKFNHSDKSPYDDPKFTLVVEISEEEADAGWWWKVVPQSVYEAGAWVDGANTQFGPEEDGAEDLSGILMASKIDETGAVVNPGAGMITEYGTFMITLDMIEGTYSFQLAVPHLYIMGDAAGWDWSSPLVAEMQTSDFCNYYAFGRCSTGGYKFTSDKDWGATFNLGLGEETTPAAGWAVAGTLVNGSSNNIMPAETGLYWHHVNLPELTFESYLVTTLGVIGDCTPNGWDASTALTPSADGLVWEGDVEFSASGSFKIRANDDWTLSLGGDVNNLGWDNAPNIETPGAGVKHVVLDLSVYPYTVTIQ